MTCEDDLSACPRSMQCKCSLYCMHADLCVCEFDFNLMWTFWITACELDICLFLLRMFKLIFAQHVAVQFLLHIYTYMCVCWDKSLIEWVRKSVLVPVLKTVLAVEPFYTTAQQTWKKAWTQAHVTEFQFRMQFFECSDKLCDINPTQTCFLDRNCVFTRFCWKCYRAQLWNSNVICKFKSLPLHDGLSSSCHCLCIVCLSL